MTTAQLILSAKLIPSIVSVVSLSVEILIKKRRLQRNWSRISWRIVERRTKAHFYSLLSAQLW